MWTRFLDLLAWIAQHPFQALGVLAIVCAVSMIIGAVVYAAMCAHEERKHAAEAEKWRRIMQAAERHDGPVPPPRASGLKGDHRRVG